MHRGHPGVRSKQKAKGYSRCLLKSLIAVKTADLTLL